MSVSKSTVLMVSAGLACAATGQFVAPETRSMADAETVRPVSVQPILGVRTDGTLVLGDTVITDEGVAAPAAAPRGSSFGPVYDSLWVADTDGDGLSDLVCGDLCAGLDLPSSRWFFGMSTATLAWVDDIEVDGQASTSFDSFDGFLMPVSFPECNPPGEEPLSILFTFYDSPVTGFDNDGDGQIDSPYSRTDANSDGLVDEFTGGVIVTFANVDTDGDTSNGNDVLDVQGGGVFLFSTLLLTDTDGDGIPGDPGAADFGSFPDTDRDGDGDPDGALEVFFTRGFGDDTDGDGQPDGPIFGAFEPSGLSPAVFFWGTPDADNSGCAAANGITEGSSSGLLWVQGEDACTPGTGMVSNVWDASTDVEDFSAVVPCPDPLTPAVYVVGSGDSVCNSLCADTNGNGIVEPGDFNAWIIQYNTQGPLCDQNNNGICEPGDFNAWIINFNLGAAGPLCDC